MFIVALVVSTSANAQEKRIATLLRELKEAQHDTVKVNKFYAISRYYWGRNVDSVVLMAARGIALADSIGFKKGKALNSLSMGAGLSGIGNYPEAIKYYLDALKLSEELHLEGLSGNVYSNIAIAYLEHGNAGKAIEYLNKALIISEKYGETATCPVLLNLSDLHTQTGEYELAKKYAMQALKISRRDADSSSIAISLFNLSETYRKTNRNDSARQYLKESSVISSRIGDFHGVSYCLNSMAEIMVSERKFHEGITVVKQSMINLKRITNHELLMKSYHILYQCYNGLGDFKQALHYRNLEVELSDHIFSIEKEHEANNLVNQYNLERKELQIQLLEKDNNLKQKEIARESLIKTIFGVGAFVLALLAAYLIYSNIRWKNYNRIVKERTTLILEQKRTIIRQKIDLERLNSTKDRIISIISHDFRSPLNTLQSFLHLVKLDVVTHEEKVQATKRIEQSLAATQTMIDNLLTWGSGQRGGLILKPVDFDLRELVKENIHLVHLRAESKNILITSDIPMSTLILGDRDTINIVLRNLISNAIKFCRLNDSISINMRTETHRVIVCVKDTGIGMSQQQQKLLFSGAVNVTTPGTEDERGTGLGLALCQELVEQHGGEIWVESSLGVGSIFYFSIPIAPSSDS